MDILLNILKIPILPPNLKPEERRKAEALRTYINIKTAITITKTTTNRAARKKGKNSNNARIIKKNKERLKTKTEQLIQQAKNFTDTNIDNSIKLPVVTTQLIFFDPPNIFRNIIYADNIKRIRTNLNYIINKSNKLYKLYT